MAKYNQDGIVNTVNIFNGLANPGRLKIICALSANGASLRPLDLWKACGTKRQQRNLRELEFAGLIERDPNYEKVAYRLSSLWVRRGRTLSIEFPKSGISLVLDTRTI